MHVTTELDEASPEPIESELERYQRNFSELLQELRVAQTGVQILFAFLLSLAVSGRFEQIGAFERTAYLVALMSAAAATALIIAPVAHHRLLFRRGHKPYLVRSAHRMALCGLSLMFVAMVSSVLLAADLVVPRPAAIGFALLIAAWFTTFWAIVPWRRRLGDPDADLITSIWD